MYSRNQILVLLIFTLRVYMRRTENTAYIRVLGKTLIQPRCDGNFLENSHHTRKTIFEECDTSLQNERDTSISRPTYTAVQCVY